MLDFGRHQMLERWWGTYYLPVTSCLGLLTSRNALAVPAQCRQLPLEISETILLAPMGKD